MGNSYLGWALDFVRAMNQRPMWAKILFRVAVGKFAYREFYGLVNSLRPDFDPTFDYGLENMDYHKDIIPFLWWKNG